MTHPAYEQNPNVDPQIAKHFDGFSSNVRGDRYSGERVSVRVGSLVMHKKTETVWKVVAREQGGRVKVCYRGANKTLKAFDKSLRVLKPLASEEDAERLEIPESRWGYDL